MSNAAWVISIVSQVGVTKDMEGALPYCGKCSQNLLLKTNTVTLLVPVLPQKKKTPSSCDKAQDKGVKRVNRLGGEITTLARIHPIHSQVCKEVCRQCKNAPGHHCRLQTS